MFQEKSILKNGLKMVNSTEFQLQKLEPSVFTWNLLLKHHVNNKNSISMLKKLCDQRWVKYMHQMTIKHMFTTIAEDSSQSDEFTCL